MKNTILYLLTASLSIVYSQELFAQEESEGYKGEHLVSVLIGHSHLDAAILYGEKQWLAVPAFGFGYSYFFHPKWAVGI